MKIKSDKIKKLFKNRIFFRFSAALAKHPVLNCIILLLFSALLSFLVFYKYVVLGPKIESEVSNKKSIFKEDLYQKIIKIQQDQEKKFQEADKKEYKNPFVTVQIPEQTPLED